MRALHLLLASGLLGPALPASAQAPPGEGPALGFDRITQADITGGGLTFDEIRLAGMKVFSTPFNAMDGYGEAYDSFDPDHTTPGNRPTMANNGRFLRVNGLDSQTCLECHFVLSNSSIPATFAVGGHGGIGATAMPGPTEVDIDDSDLNGWAFYNGRLINPPFVFGAGGVELVAKEMTIDLQALKAKAQEHPGTVIPLLTKGVSFGSIVYDPIEGFDTSLVEGVSDDLVVRPFGRKGDNATIRKFDTGALAFHHGMQPQEVVGTGVDGDGDGVADEILVGELSAMHIFSVSLERPRREKTNEPAVQAGDQIFQSIGCADCHVPSIVTRSRKLPIAFPEVETDPLANVFYLVDLSKRPPKFKRVGRGVRVEMYSDLKRHFMGPDLAEHTGGLLAGHFITPRLWGVADTAPYLHDGRALTLTEAIELHGGEAQLAADAFDALSDGDKIDLLTFLRTLRVPSKVNQGAGGSPQQLGEVQPTSLLATGRR